MYKVVSIHLYSHHQRIAGLENLSISEIIEHSLYRISIVGRCTNQVDEIIENYVGNFKNIEEKLEEICKRIYISKQFMGSFPQPNTNHRKKSSRDSLSDEYTKKSGNYAKKR